MMVCALMLYAPRCMSDITFSIFASTMASGRKPSKLTINTRSDFGMGVGAGVIVGAGVSVGKGAGVLLGTGVSVRITGTATGGGTGANDPQACKRIANKVNIQIRLLIIKLRFRSTAGILFMHRQHGLPKGRIHRDTIPIRLKRQAQSVRRSNSSVGRGYHKS